MIVYKYILKTSFNAIIIVSQCTHSWMCGHVCERNRQKNPQKTMNQELSINL